MKALHYLRDRFKEPATYAGIGIVAVAFFGPEAQTTVDLLTQVGLGLAGLLAVVLREGAQK